MQGVGPVRTSHLPLHCSLLKTRIQWDQRLLTFDPVALSHITRNSNIYEKPWQAQRIISSIIGCGLLSAEGAVHKRQRRVAAPTFSIQNLRALVPVMFEKAFRLRNRWRNLINESGGLEGGAVLDICMWASRATFDVISAAGSWIFPHRAFFFEAKWARRIRLRLQLDRGRYKRALSCV